MTISVAQMNASLSALASTHAHLFDQAIADLTPAQRLFRCVWELEGEVNGGGFHLYFTNADGALVGSSVEALKTLGAPRMANIVNQAIAALGPHMDWNDRSRVVERLASEDMTAEMDEKLDALSGEFCAYPEPLTPLLYSYVSRHRVELGVSSDF